MSSFIFGFLIFDTVEWKANQANNNGGHCICQIGKSSTDAEVLLKNPFFLFSSKKSLQQGHKVADELQRLQINSCEIKYRWQMTSFVFFKKKDSVKARAISALLGAFLKN